MALAAGDKVGPYEVLGVLGAGGMGVVFRARDSRLGREVALKALPEASKADPDRLKRFEQETQAAGALNHPNVLSVFDVGRHDGTPYLVTELLEGTTLRQRLREGPLPPRKATEYAAQIARGLAAVHEKGIVHRDLKPENLFVTREGHVKILDFGVARAMESAEVIPATTLPITASGAVMGTAGYMSPEQVRGRPADARSDIFSLGSILYEMVTGELAFPGDTAVERGYAVLNADPREPLRVGVRLSPALDRVMRRCLEKSPDERFQSARDLSFALEAITDASGSQPTPTLPAPRSSTRALALVTAAALVAAVGLALGWWSAGRAAATSPSPSPAASQPTFTRLTFRPGFIGGARFASGRTVVYWGALQGGTPQVYAGTPGNPNARSLFGEYIGLFDVSGRDEVALLIRSDAANKHSKAVLARAPLGGGTPRQVLEDVVYADFSPDGRQLLVVRREKGRFWLEYPPGNVVFTPSEAIMAARLSPDGRRIAVTLHPVRDDDRGRVEIIDLTGQRLARSRDWWTLEGLAWSASGDEVWYSAASRDVQRGIFALSLQGGERTVLVAPGNLLIQDVQPDGRALLLMDSTRHRMFGKLPGKDREVELSWFDGTMPVDLTPDGKTLLLLEGYGAGEDEVQAFLRRSDSDAAPVQLARGWPRALSPDGKWVLVSPEPPFNTLTLVPTGPGESRPLPLGELREVANARFFADGKRVLIHGRGEKKGPLQLWVLDLDQGEARRISEEGLADSWQPSPDGKRAVAQKPDGTRGLVALDTGELEALPELKEWWPVGWTEDGGGLWVYQLSGPHHTLPLQLYRFDLATRKLTLVRTLNVSDPVGVLSVKRLVLTPDAKSYVYVVPQKLGELYLVDGLR